MVRNGAQITLEVNGTPLGTWSDGTIGGLTGAGLVSSPYNDIPSSDARFDNFSVVSSDGSPSAMLEDAGGGMRQSEVGRDR